MNWLGKLFSSKIRINEQNKKAMPDGVWTKCENCQFTLYLPELMRAYYVCPKCEHHHYWPARERLLALLDEANRQNDDTIFPQEIGVNLSPKDFLKFKDTKKYKDRLTQLHKQLPEKDAMVVMQGSINGLPVVFAAFEYRFIGGSMGAVVGEKFVLAANKALEEKIPFVCFTASGGARMQEALVSLFQMAKTSAVIQRLSDQKIPYITVLTDPTMGGVSASLATLGDIIIAEPNARIGFAGARVIEQTVREVLPEGFQRSEFLLKHGALDMIVARQDLKETLYRLLSKLGQV